MAETNVCTCLLPLSRDAVVVTRMSATHPHPIHCVEVFEVIFPAWGIDKVNCLPLRCMIVLSLIITGLQFLQYCYMKHRTMEVVLLYKNVHGMNIPHVYQQAR